MPICELQEGIPRLKRLGIIRLGKPKGENRPGRPSEHFELRDAPEVAEVYGPSPTRLNILLPFDDIDLVLDAWHRLYGAGSLKCRGDGNTIDYMVDEGGQALVAQGFARRSFHLNGERFEEGDAVPCGGFKKIYPRCRGCSPRAILRVMIQEILRLGYWQIGTGSKHSILNLTGELKWAKRLFGKLVGIPFVLELTPEPISVPMEDHRVRMEKYILHVEPHPDWISAQLEHLQSQFLGRWEAVPSLPGLKASTEDRGEESKDKLPGEEEMVKSPAATLKMAAIKTWGDCWQRVLQHFGLTRSQALAQLETTRQEDLAQSPREVYKEIATLMEPPI